MDALFNIACFILSIAVIAAAACSIARFCSIRKEERLNEAELLLKKARASNPDPDGTRGVRIEVREPSKTQAALLEAGMQIDPALWRMLEVGCALAAFGLVFFAAKASSPASSAVFDGAAALVAAAAVLTFFKHHIRSKARKRTLLLEKQLAQVEMQIAENSRSGLPVSRSILACSELSEEPLRGHLKRLYNEMTFSDATLSEGFENMAKRTRSSDVKLLAEVISIQERTGSNLADALDFLHETISRRLEMRQSLQSALAETKITRTIVAITPWAIFALLAFAPLVRIEGFWEFYSTNPIGWAVLFGCIVIEAGILALISKMSDLQLD